MCKILKEKVENKKNSKRHKNRNKKFTNIQNSSNSKDEIINPIKNKFNQEDLKQQYQQIEDEGDENMQGNLNDKHKNIKNENNKEPVQNPELEKEEKNEEIDNEFQLEINGEVQNLELGEKKEQAPKSKGKEDQVKNLKQDDNKEPEHAQKQKLEDEKEQVQNQNPELENQQKKEELVQNPKNVDKKANGNENLNNDNEHDNINNENNNKENDQDKNQKEEKKVNDNGKQDEKVFLKLGEVYYKTSVEECKTIFKKISDRENPGMVEFEAEPYSPQYVIENFFKNESPVAIENVDQNKVVGYKTHTFNEQTQKFEPIQNEIDNNLQHDNEIVPKIKLELNDNELLYRVNNKFYIITNDKFEEIQNYLNPNEGDINTNDKSELGVFNKFFKDADGIELNTYDISNLKTVHYKDPNKKDEIVNDQILQNNNANNQQANANNRNVNNVDDPRWVIMKPNATKAEREQVLKTKLAETQDFRDAIFRWCVENEHGSVEKAIENGIIYTDKGEQINSLYSVVLPEKQQQNMIQRLVGRIQRLFGADGINKGLIDRIYHGSIGNSFIMIDKNGNPKKLYVKKDDDKNIKLVEKKDDWIGPVAADNNPWKWYKVLLALVYAIIKFIEVVHNLIANKVEKNRLKACKRQYNAVQQRIKREEEAKGRIRFQKSANQTKDVEVMQNLSNVQVETLRLQQQIDTVYDYKVKKYVEDCMTNNAEVAKKEFNELKSILNIKKGLAAERDNQVEVMQNDVKPTNTLNYENEKDTIKRNEEIFNNMLNRYQKLQIEANKMQIVQEYKNIIELQANENNAKENNKLKDKKDNAKGNNKLKEKKDNIIDNKVDIKAIEDAKKSIEDALKKDNEVLAANQNIYRKNIVVPEVKNDFPQAINQNNGLNNNLENKLEQNKQNDKINDVNKINNVNKINKEQQQIKQNVDAHPVMGNK